MRNFLGSLRIDLQRAFLSGYFWLAILLVLLLNYVSVFMEIRLNGSINAIYLLSTFCFGGDNTIVLLFLGSLPYAKSFVTDWNTQFLRFHLIRTSPDGYTWSKVITVFLSSAISIGMGFALTILCFSLHMPLGNDNVGEMIMGLPAYGQLLNNSYLLFFAAQISALALGVSVWAVAALFLSAYVTNAFVVLASPVIAYYVIINSIGRYLPTLLNMDRFMLGNVTLGSAGSTFIYTLLYCLLLTIILGFGFSRKVKKRIDHG